MSASRVLFVCNHDEEFVKEIDDIKLKRIPAISQSLYGNPNFMHCFNLSKFLPMTISEWLKSFEDLPKICLDCVTMPYFAIVFFLSDCKYKSCQCLLNKYPDAMDEISLAFEKTSLSGRYGWICSPPYSQHTVADIMAIVVAGLTPEPTVTEKVIYFFKDNGLIGTRNLEKLQDTLLKNGLNVYTYREPDEPGEIIQLELMQKIPFSNINSQHIKTSSSGIMDEYLTYQMNEYRPSSPLTHLQLTLSEFCNEAYNDKLECGADSLEPILRTYRAKDWSDKFLSQASLNSNSRDPADDSSRNRILLLAGEPGIGRTCFLVSWLENYKNLLDMSLLNKPKGVDKTQVKEAKDGLSSNIDSLRNNMTILGESGRNVKRCVPPIVIKHFVIPNVKKSADLWIVLEELISDIRKACGVGRDLNATSPCTLSALTAGLADHERARQLRQVGDRFFKALGLNRLANTEGSFRPMIVLIDGLDQLEDPLSSSPEGVKNMDWLYNPLYEQDIKSQESTHCKGMPMVPPGVRLILTCSKAHSVFHRLSSCPLVKVVHFPPNVASIQTIATGLHVSSLTRPTGSLRNSAAPKVHRQQPSDLVSLMPNLTDWAVVSNSDHLSPAADSCTEMHDYSENEKCIQIVRSRIVDCAAARAYEQWPLRHVPLARKMLAQELHSTSFGFSSTRGAREIASWNDYRDRLLATQSLRQMISCLIRRWAKDVEVDLLDLEQVSKEGGITVRSGAIFPSHSLWTLSDGTKESEVSISERKKKLARRLLLKQITKDWTRGFVALVLHCCLAANEFTWCSDDGLYHGFGMEDLLQILQRLPTTDNAAMQQVLQTTVTACHSSLLPYILLRLLHRAGSFSLVTGGAILRQTGCGGYLIFGHEMVHAVLYQMLSRDGGGTGVQLPLESCALQWHAMISDAQFRNLLRTHGEQIRPHGVPNRSTSSGSFELSESDKKSPRVTFRQVGASIQVLMKLERRVLHTSDQNNAARKKTETSYSNVDYSDSVETTELASFLVKEPESSLTMTAPTRSLTFSESRTDSGSFTGTESRMDERASTRHGALLCTIAKLALAKNDYFQHTHFALQLLASHIMKIAIFPGATAIESALDQLNNLLCDPKLLLCVGWPHLKTGPFLGTIPNAHLLVTYWKFARVVSLRLERCRRDDNPNGKFAPPIEIALSLSSDSDATRTSDAESEQVNPANPYYRMIDIRLHKVARDAIRLLVSGDSDKIGLGDSQIPMDNMKSLKEIKATEFPNALESLVWICGELFYLLRYETEAVNILFELAQMFLRRQSLKLNDLMQLTHLGLSLAQKRRILPHNAKRWEDNIQNLATAIEARLEEEAKDILGLDLFGRRAYEMNVPGSDAYNGLQSLLTDLEHAYAYLKIMRIEADMHSFSEEHQTIIPELPTVDSFFLKSVVVRSQYNCAALSATAQELLALTTEVRSIFESLISEAISTLVSDQGVYDPRLVVWLLNYACSLQEPVDEEFPNEASFLRVASRRTRAACCIRWALDIISPDRELLVRPVGRLPILVAKGTNERSDLKICRSLLHRQPRHIIFPSKTNLEPKTSLKTDLTFIPKSQLGESTLDSRASVSYHKRCPKTDVDDLTTIIRLQLINCLLEDGRHLNMKEALAHAAEVFHERVTLLGADHPASNETHRWMRQIEHQLAMYDKPGHAYSMVAQTIDRQNEEVRQASVNHSQSAQPTESPKTTQSTMSSDSSTSSRIYGPPFGPPKKFRLIHSLERKSMRAEIVRDSLLTDAPLRYPIRIGSAQRKEYSTMVQLPTGSCSVKANNWGQRTKLNSTLPPTRRSGFSRQKQGKNHSKSPDLGRQLPCDTITVLYGTKAALQPRQVPLPATAR